MRLFRSHAKHSSACFRSSDLPKRSAPRTAPRPPKMTSTMSCRNTIRRRASGVGLGQGGERVPMGTRKRRAAWPDRRVSASEPNLGARNGRKGATNRAEPKVRPFLWYCASKLYRLSDRHAGLKTEGNRADCPSQAQNPYVLIVRMSLMFEICSAFGRLERGWGRQMMLGS